MYILNLVPLTVYLRNKKLAHSDRAAHGRGFSEIFVIFLHARRARRARAGLTVYPGSGAQLALWPDEVRILIFDDPAEQEHWQHLEFCSSQLNSIHIVFIGSDTTVSDRYV